MKMHTKAQSWEQTQSSLAVHAARLHVPMRGSFELTSRCNFKCKMCYICNQTESISAIKSRELTAEQWLNIARDAANNGTLYLMLTGGEPLIREDFEYIYKELCKMGFIITLNTNASLMNDRYYELFSKYPPSSVSLTLYGANEETYSKVTGFGGHFNKVIKGLEYFADLPSILEIKSTFIKDNKDNISEIRELANRYSKHFAINFMVFKSIHGAVSQAEKCRLSPKECIAVDNENKLYYNRLQADLKHNENTASHDATTDIIPHYSDHGGDISPKALRCLSAKSAYWISWDGRMLPCGVFDLATYPLKEGFKAAWDRLPSLFEDLKKPQQCLECEHNAYCPNCPAYVYLETGSFDKEAPEYICALVKERSESIKKSRDNYSPE